MKFIGIPEDDRQRSGPHRPYTGIRKCCKICSLPRSARSSSTPLVYQQKSVTIVEIMGRHAGWLTAASRLARKPDEGDNPYLILPSGGSVLLRAAPIKTWRKRSKSLRNLVVCVSEGIADEGGSIHLMW
ncbi:MAG: hypothetical protein ACLUAR_17000 [Pilosibacter sp.]